MKILVVDDHVLFREGLVSMLNSQPDMTVVGEAGTVHEAVLKARELKPETILLDFGLPDGNGTAASRQIISEFPDVKIVFLTVHDADDRLLAAIKSGAKGYLLKDLPFTKLLASLRGLDQDEAALSRKLTMRILDNLDHFTPQDEMNSSKLADLSIREVEILRELAHDASNNEIALHFSLSVATVKNHIHRILGKLELRNRQDAARFARHHGLGKSYPQIMHDQ